MNPETQMLVEPHDDESMHYYVVDRASEMAAVITTTRLNAQNYPAHWHTSFPLDKFEDFPEESISVTSRLVARKDFRGSPALVRLFAKVYADFVASLGLLNFAYCALPLVRLYARMGYRRFTSGFNTPEGTFRIPLVLDLQDRQHLELVGSPFLKTPWWRESRDTSAGKRWTLKERLPGVVLYLHDGLLLDQQTAKGFWEILCRFRGSGTQWVAPEFHQVERWLRRGIEVDLQCGDCPLPPGLTSECLYFCLEGTFEVREEGKVVKTLGPGSCLGGRSALVEESRRFGVFVRGRGRLLALEKPGSIGFKLLGESVAESILHILSDEVGVDFQEMK